MLRARLLRNADALSSCSNHRLAVAALGAPARADTPSPPRPPRRGCPTASFIPVRLLASQPQTRSYATRPKHLRRREKVQEQQRIPKYLDSLILLRSAIDDGDIDLIIQGYDAIRTSFQLGGDDVAAIVHALHTALRQQKPAKTEQRIPPQLIAFADTLVSDIRARKLPPNHAAHLHLLSFYKEARQFERGSTFWAWLVDQDDSHVNPAIYGVAIELLAVQGKPAVDTEDLFTRALARFPGMFNEYHLSPNAVVPDRAQPINIRGIPMTLLQGILTARLLRGDSRDAYLALDTALRLYPTQVPSRFFTVFVEERPVTEAYDVFLVACRSGTTLGPDSLKILLTKMRAVVASDPVANASVLRSMVTASYAYAAAGNPVTGNHLTELTIGITTLLQDRSLARVPSHDLKPVTDKILNALQTLFKIWSLQGTSPGIATFNSIISNVAGKGGRRDVIVDCLAEIEALGLQPNAVTRRSLLTAAGAIGDVELVKMAWIELLSLRQSTGTPLDLGDWQTLAKAARRAKCEDLASQQLSDLADLVHPAVAARINGLLQDEHADQDIQAHGSSSVEPALQIASNISEDVQYMEDSLEKGPDWGLYLHPLALSLDTPLATASPLDQDLRSVYDEFTAGTSPSPVLQNNTIASDEPRPDSSAFDSLPETLNSPAMSSTGFTFDRLRYENWKSINELLAEAERHDSDYLFAVDKAIADGTLPPKRTMGLQPSDEVGPSIGLSDFAIEPTTGTTRHESLHSKSKASHTSQDDLRQRIRSLRGM